MPVPTALEALANTSTKGREVLRTGKLTVLPVKLVGAYRTSQINIPDKTGTGDIGADQTVGDKGCGKC